MAPALFMALLLLGPAAAPAAGGELSCGGIAPLDLACAVQLPVPRNLAISLATSAVFAGVVVITGETPAGTWFTFTCRIVGAPLPPLSSCKTVYGPAPSLGDPLTVSARVLDWPPVEQQPALALPPFGFWALHVTAS